MIPKKPLFRPDEVAEILRVTRQTVYNLVNRGDLEGIKVAGRLRIKRESVLAILEC